MDEELPPRPRRRARAPARPAGTRQPDPVSPAVRRWFEEHTHRTMRNGLEDGSDLDIDRYVDHFIDAAAGEADEPRVFRDLVPGVRDVTTALLLDGSSSLGAHGGQVFELELACADSLSQAMTLARERHGIFVFTGNTRHRVDVRCLKDFDQTPLRRPERPRPRHRWLHPARRADPPPHEPPARPAVGAAAADPDRRRAHVRRGLRGPLRLGRRRPRRRGGRRGRRRRSTTSVSGRPASTRCPRCSARAGRSASVASTSSRASSPTSTASWSRHDRRQPSNVTTDTTRDGDEVQLFEHAFRPPAARDAHRARPAAARPGSSSTWARCCDGPS